MKRVIVDVDVGTDDYMALLILLYAEKIGQLKIEAIFCSMGNTTIDFVCKNLVRLLELVNRTDIPIYKGAKEPIIPPKVNDIPGYHGEDGFGNLKYDTEPNLAIIRNTPSAVALRNMVIENPKEISLIFLGPLTNLALSLKIHDDVADNIKDLWIMGGNYKGVGNTTPHAEFNFYVDPEAAHIVFESIRCPLYMLPWEACLVPKISLEWRYDVLGSKSPALELLSKAEKIVHADQKYWLPCDAFVAFAFLNPEKNITKRSEHYATVDVHHPTTRGQVVLHSLENRNANVIVIEMIDEELFMETVLHTKNV